MAAAMQLAPGATILATYRLERPLAAGGMGSVWVASHVGTGAQVAVKFMDAGQGDSVGRARFEREANSLAAIHNPHVVAVRDYGMEEGAPFIVMDLLEGEDLRARLRRVRRLSLPDASHLLTQIARGLAAAHAVGIVHRDLKPANVFMAVSEGEETVKILDFGLAKNAVAGAVGEGTRTGDLVGSPHFMSPEQIRSPNALDYRSDLWSLSVLMFRVLTGGLPFKGEQVGTVLAKILTDPIPRATSAAPGLPPALDDFFARGFARDPAQRFQSAQDMAVDLARIAAHELTSDGSRPEDPDGNGTTRVASSALVDSMRSLAPASSGSASHSLRHAGPSPFSPGHAGHGSWSGQHGPPLMPPGSWSGQYALAPMPPGSWSGQHIPPAATTAAPPPEKRTAWLPWIIAVAAVAAALSMGVLVFTRHPGPDDRAETAVRGEASGAVAGLPSAPQAALDPESPAAARATPVTAPAAPVPGAASSTAARAAASSAPDRRAPTTAPLPRPPRTPSEPPQKKTPTWGF
jgi:serine/threonine-protein kinase